MGNEKNKVLLGLKHIQGLFLLLLLYSFFLRVFELFHVTYFLKLPWPLHLFFDSSLYLDLLSIICYLALFAPLFWVIQFTKLKLSTLTLALYILFGTISLLLSAFHMSAGRLLGEEIVRYNVFEFLAVIKTGVTINLVLYVLLNLLSLLLLYILIKNTFFRYRINSNAKWVFYSLFSIISLLIWSNNKSALFEIRKIDRFEDISSFYLGNNKISYFNARLLSFVDNSIELKYSPIEIKAASINHFDRVKKKVDMQLPFYKDSIQPCSISEYFTDSQKKPNIVLIITESLSSAFSGPSNYLGSYTPFLDSLANHSLYWPNTLSGADRTFAALPNILGGLPYGRDINGFINDQELNTRNYNSLPTALLKNYHVNFFYPGWPGFDKMDSFMKLNGATVYAEKDIEKQFPNAQKFNWGYDDQTLILYTLEKQKNTEKNKPFFNIILTLGIHQPYDHVPQNISNEKYLYSKNIQKGKIKRKEIARSIFLTDDAIKSYFDSLRDTEQFKNTIFIITGDHGLGTDIPLKSPIEGYRVPLIIYSTMLKSSRKFNSVVTHRDIFQTLSSLLKYNYDLDLTDGISNLGKQLDTSNSFRSNVSASLNIFESSKPSFIEGKYYLFDDNLYEIKDSLLYSEIVYNDSILNELQNRVEERKILNEYAIGQNMLIK